MAAAGLFGLALGLAVTWAMSTAAVDPPPARTTTEGARQ